MERRYKPVADDFPLRGPQNYWDPKVKAALDEVAAKVKRYHERN